MIWSTGFSRSKDLPRFRDTAPSRGACRNLFGPVDHRELREDLEKERRDHLEAKKWEYNFDFEKDEPLPGRYVWEKLSSTTLGKSSTCSKTNCEALVTTVEPLGVSKTQPTLSTTSSGKRDDGRSNTGSKKNPVEHKITGRFTRMN